MFNVKAVIKGLSGAIGFKQIHHPSIPKLTSNLTESKSGQYFNEIHPLLNAVNIHATLDTDQYRPDPFKNGNTYPARSLVLFDGILHEAINDTAATPTDLTNWQPTNALSLYLRDLVEESIIETITYIFRQKKIGDTLNTIFKDQPLFQTVGNRNLLIIKQGRFVGLAITVKSGVDVKVTLNKIGVQIHAPGQVIPLYIYHESQAEPIAQYEALNSYGSNFSWVDTKALDLAFVGEQLNGTGTFYIGYYEDDFTGQAAEVQRDLSTYPCRTCNDYDLAAYKNWSKFVDIHPFSVSEDFLPTGNVLWDIKANSYNYSTNFGLNLQLTASCDLTEFLLRHQAILIDALRHVVACKLLEKMAFNIESKGLSEKVRQLAMFELDNRENNTKGMTYKKEKALEALQFDMSKINNICLPCKPSKIRDTAIGFYG